MKKGVIAGMVVLFFILNFVSAAECQLGVEIINQDPYPAIPGEYVKVVFQVSGVENPSCEGARVQLLPKYPFSLDGVNTIRVMQENTYTTGYDSYWNLPYQIRVDKDSVKGENKITLEYWSGRVGSAKISRDFEIEVEDSQADFEIHLQDYSYQTKEITFEILNIGESDVEALTLEIPKQENIKIIGTNRVIAGDLDSNEYTTADFKAELNDGAIRVNIIYTDSIGIRRTVEKQVEFDSDYFKGTLQTQRSPIWTVVILILVGGGIWWFFKKGRNNHRKNFHQHKKGMARF